VRSSTSSGVAGIEVSQPCEAPERGVGRDERLCAASHGGGGKDRVEGTEAVLLGEMSSPACRSS
jgi:hypothetical protein